MSFEDPQGFPYFTEYSDEETIFFGVLQALEDRSSEIAGPRWTEGKPRAFKFPIEYVIDLDDEEGLLLDSAAISNQIGITLRGAHERDHLDTPCTQQVYEISLRSAIDTKISLVPEDHRGLLFDFLVKEFPSVIAHYLPEDVPEEAGEVLDPDQLPMDTITAILGRLFSETNTSLAEARNDTYTIQEAQQRIDYRASVSYLIDNEEAEISSYCSNVFARYIAVHSPQLDDHKNEYLLDAEETGLTFPERETRNDPDAILVTHDFNAIIEKIPDTDIMGISYLDHAKRILGMIAAHRKFISEYQD